MVGDVIGVEDKRSIEQIFPILVISEGESRSNRNVKTLDEYVKDGSA